MSIHALKLTIIKKMKINADHLNLYV